MIDAAARYAVYFVPATSSDLYHFGSAVLGYDCYTGEAVPLPPELHRNAEAWRRLTGEPRRYGFHATLKPPFHLAQSCSEAQLSEAFFDFVGTGHAVPRFDAELRMLGDFAALVPQRPSAEACALADLCTTVFDRFRAPMSPREQARRAAAGLSESQRQNLERWGYPYVFGDFRFHMTLTGKISGECADRVCAELQAGYTRACPDRWIAVDRLALLKQDGEGAPFRVLHHAEIKR